MLFLPNLLLGQICHLPPTGGEDCPDAPLMSCNLDGYLGTSNGFQPGPSPPGFCGIIENNQWFSFEVDEVPVILQITPSNCTNNEGLQAGLYTTPDCVNMTSQSNCASFGNMNTLTVTSTTVTVGQIAYLMIDGFEGDLCDFEITVVAGILPDATANASDATICPGNEIQLDGTGSTVGPDVIYTWTTIDGNIVSGANTLNASVDQAGSYTLMVNDTMSCCFEEITIEVTPDSDLPVINFEQVDELNCDNTVVAINTNMDVPANYNFNWDTGDGNITSGTTMASISVDETGTYNVTVVDANTGCSNIGFITMSEDVTPPTVTAGADSNLDCTVTSTDLSADSPDSMLDYAWSGPNGFMADIENPTISSEGTYTILVTASNGCTAEDFVVVTKDADLPNISVAPPEQINCNVLTIDLEGASTTMNVQFDWVGPNGFSSNIADPTTTEPGMYTLTVTTTSGCTATQTVEVIEDVAVPDISIGNPQDLDCTNTTVTLLGSSSTINADFAWTGPNGFTDVAAQPEVTDPGNYVLLITAPNGCTAQMDVTVDQVGDLPAADAGNMQTLTCITTSVEIGGTGSEMGADISYTWFDENGLAVGNAPTTSVSDPGSYTLVVSNATTGCSNESMVVVDANTVEPIADAGNNLLLSCTDSQVTTEGTASSSGPDITYEWLDVDGNVLSTSVNADLAAAGIYSLVVTDNSNGCTGTSSVEVAQDANVPVSIAAVDEELTCLSTSVELLSMGSSTGADISYEWTDDAGNSLGAAETINVSQAGIYNLVVTDNANGCSSNSTVTVMENIAEPTIAIEEPSILTCLIPETDLNASASSSANAGTLTAVWTDAGGAVVGSTLSIPTDVAGMYTLVLTDDLNGCSATDQIEVTEDKVIPIADTDGMEMLTCIVGEVELTTGTSTTGADIAYEWFDATGSSISQSTTLSVTTPGAYTMVVTNTTSGCTSDVTFEIQEDKTAPEAVAIADGLLTCIQSAVPLNGSQSTSQGGIDFRWEDPTGTTIGTEEFASSTEAGQYTLYVTDQANGCEDVETIMIMEDIEVPTIDPSTPEILTCVTLTTSLNVGVPNVNTPDLTWTDAAGNMLSTDDNLIADQAGIYEVIVTDPENGCTSDMQIEVLQDVEAPELGNIDADILTCINLSVDLEANLNNVVSNTSYEWVDATGTSVGSSQIISTTDAGFYTVEVTNDDNGCTTNATVEVIEDVDAPQPMIDFDGLTLNCMIDQLSLDANLSQGDSDLSFRWRDQFDNTVSSSSDILISNSGVYTMTVTQESNGCTAEEIIEIIEDFETPILEFTSVGVITCRDQVVNVEGSASGANENFAYEWRDLQNGIISGEDTPNPEIEIPGTYTFVVTDVLNGCQDSLDVIVEQDIELPEAIAEAEEILDCITESVNLSVAGSSTGDDISYLWIGDDIIEGANTASPEVGSAGLYQLTVINQNTGCENYAEVMVEENTERPTGALTTVINPSCFGDGNGEIQVGPVFGGTAPYMYAINDASNLNSNPNVDNLTEGEYQLFIQDASGCEWDTSVFIINPEPIDVELGADITIKLGESVNLQADVNKPITTAEWYADIGTVQNSSNLTAEVSPIETTEYSVFVTNEDGCTSEDHIVVRVEVERNVYIPNAFSPNADGKNDFFTVFSDEVIKEVSQMSVFDKWGNQVFVKENFAPNDEVQGWDGKYRERSMQPGVFVYSVTVEFIDGKFGTYHGDLTLIY